MRRLPRRTLAAFVISGMTASAALAQQAQPISEQEIRDIARDAYIYAYPMLVMEMTRRVSTNVEKPAGAHAPMNQIVNVRAFPTPLFTDVVRPNADTLYSAMFFDVSKDPMVFSVPDSGGRYYLLPMLDMWTDVFAVPGKRTTGTGAQTFAVVGPHWQGQLPKGMDLIKSPTSTVFLIGRTQTNGKADYAAVHKFQDGLKAVPLSRYGKAYTPPNGTVNATLDMSAPSGQVHKMDAATFFATFAELMKTNPPHANDYPILARMQRIGIEPGKSFSLASASPEVRRALEAAVPEAQQDIEASIHRSGVMANGWRINLSAVGTYGTDYLQRAGIAYAGLGANTIQDAVYPTLFTDTNGEPLRAERRYQMHFDKDQIPPVRAFWSLTCLLYTSPSPRD